MALKTPASDDHRIRVGRERTEKMRKRLLAAIMASYAQYERPKTPMLDDVIRQAHVSRVTFYKHFTSLEDAVNALGQELVEEVLHNLALLVNRSSEPLSRMAIGIQTFLLRSITDPLWGIFVSRTDFLSTDSVLLKTIAADLSDAKARGLVEFTNIEAATSLFIGALMEAIRHLVNRAQRSRAYVEEINVLILRGLGVERQHATDIVNSQAAYVRKLAPDFLPWWRDPWQEAEIAAAGR